MGTEREQSLGFLLGKIPPREMPQAWNVAYSFDVDIKLSTGNQIKLISGKNELLISGEEGKIRVNRGSLTGAPVEEVDADQDAVAVVPTRYVEVLAARRTAADEHGIVAALLRLERSIRAQPAPLPGNPPSRPGVRPMLVLGS